MLCDWSRKLAPLSEPIKFKTNLVTTIFPLLMALRFDYFEFSLVTFNVKLLTDWLWQLLWQLLWSIASVNCFGTILDSKALHTLFFYGISMKKRYDNVFLSFRAFLISQTLFNFTFTFPFLVIY